MIASRLLKALFGSKKAYCVPIGDYPNTFIKLSKSIKAPDLAAAYRKMRVSCYSCGFRFNRKALDTLFLMAPGAVFSGEGNIALGGKDRGNDLRAGKCPECGHSYIKIVVEET